MAILEPGKRYAASEEARRKHEIGRAANANRRLFIEMMNARSPFAKHMER